MAIIFNNKKKKGKIEKDHSYAGFWLDRGAANVNMDGRSSASSVVKAIKLRNYQKAIGNFVKILSQRDVPVLFRGTESYTDFDHVTIAGNITDKNFDVTAGLALHEASHLKHTQKEVLTTFMKEYDRLDKREIKDMLNWIEDRRIDTIVFKNCPGYKAYYHQMYDHYFRNSDIAKMLKSPKYCTPTMENFFAHIISMMNPAFDSRRIVGLTEITKLIDVNNISRLQDTAAALALAEEVVAKINEIIKEAQTQEEDEQPGAGESEEQEEQEEQEDQEDQSGPDSSDEEEQDTEGDGSGGTEGDEGAGEEDGEGNEGPEMRDLTPQEEQKVREALEEAKEQVKQTVKKKQIARNISKKIIQLQDSEIDFAAVGNGSKKQDCLIYRLDKEVHKLAAVTKANEYLAELRAEDKFVGYYSNGKKSQEQVDAEKTCKGYDGPAGLARLSYNGRLGNKPMEKFVNEGLQLGAMLGRKLLTRRESRSLETNRLRSGRIDNKRLAHAGYGIENIFSQIHIEKYKKANIHLTIDASGSMGGERWNNSIKMAAAIGKAVSMIDGLELQVSMRETDHNDTPVVTIIYDSRANRLGHLTSLLNIYDCNSMTPEGLCLEALLKKNLLIPSNEECDSYLINICDGSPGCGNYGGRSALSHTKQQVKRINNELGINHVGFFFGDPERYGFAQFKEMYGAKQSKALPDASNATAIATHMNKELMNK
jgi:hypothetical protein